MLAPDRITHLHLPKTGGTTLNTWLATLVPWERVRPLDRSLLIAAQAKELELAIGGDAMPGHQLPLIAREIGRECAAYWDVVCDHDPACMTYAHNSYRIVILRDPTERILSCYRDWRRLSAEDIARAPEEQRAVRQAAIDLSPDEWVKKLERFPGLSHAAPNLQCSVLARALAHYRATKSADLYSVSAIDLALTALDKCFSVVGFTDLLPQLINHIARDLGRPPVTAVAKLNSGETGAHYDLLSEESREILYRHNRDDVLLVERARAHWQAICVDDYTEEHFERNYAIHLLSRLRPQITDGWCNFSVNDRIIGSGFHGRDSAGLDNVNLWTGPTCRSVLYVPVPENEFVLLYLDIGYYMPHPNGGSVRDGLRIVCDDAEAAIHTSPSANVVERLIVPCLTRRRYVKLEIFVRETVNSTMLGDGSADLRLRGIGIRQYGFRLAPAISGAVLPIDFAGLGRITACANPPPQECGG